MKWVYRLLGLLDRIRVSLAALPSSKPGQLGEAIAHRYLQSRGFKVVARNWRPRHGRGEVDLIAYDGDYLVFVEVKTRQSAEFGDPERNIDRQKVRAMTRSAYQFARRASVPFDKIRFDLVTVVLSDPPRVNHTPDFFSPRRPR